MTASFQVPFPLFYFSVSSTGLLNEFGDQSCPAGLMTGPEAGTVIAMKMFMEKNEIAPVRIFLEDTLSAINGSISVVIAQKKFGQPP